MYAEAKRLNARAEQIIQLEKEIAHLRQMFDGTRKGFGEFASKQIKIPYRHIAGPEFSVSKNGIKMSGLHHDVGLAVERSGLLKFTDKVMCEHGFYKAKVWFDGLGNKKTFFPSHWPREKVIAKVIEAYDNFIATGARNYIEEAGNLGSFLAIDVGCYNPSYKEFLLDEKQPAIGGNYSYTFKDGDYLFTGHEVESEDTYLKIHKDEFIKILDAWEQFCKTKPKEIIITKDGEKFTIESKD